MFSLWFLVVITFGFSYGERHGRIIGGYYIEIQEAPYAAYLELKDTDDSIVAAHGGSIISPKHILTCVICANNLNQLAFMYIMSTVKTGTSYLDQGGLVRNISYYVFHPEFDYPNLDNDIAIGFAESGIEFNAFQSPIALPKRPVSARRFSIAGWGCSDRQCPSVLLSNQLKIARLPRFDNQACANLYKDSIKKSTKTIFCIGFDYEGGPNIREADTGDGVISFEENVIAGVASSFKDGQPILVTAVEPYVPWIQMLINDRI